MKLKWPSAATMRWSRTRTLINLPTSRKRQVISTSSGLGEGSPLGWLWTGITAAADSRTAGAKTSRGWTIDAVREPSDTRTSRSFRCFASSRMTQNTSFRRGARRPRGSVRRRRHSSGSSPQLEAGARPGVARAQLLQAMTAPWPGPTPRRTLRLRARRNAHGDAHLAANQSSIVP